MGMSKTFKSHSEFVIMQTFVGLLVLSLALVANGASLNPRIVGGTDAPEGKYPYQISTWIFESMFHCGGSIIHHRYILTAAHCLDTLSADQISVTVGNHLLSQLGKRYQAEKLIVHKEWSSETIANDIGLIRLSEDIVYSDKVQPIVLPASNYNQSSPDVVLTGWGQLSYPGSYPDHLQQINLKIISQEQCQTIFSNVTSKQICTLTKRGEGSCSGDSGGPLVADGVQVGIVSYGMPCGVGWPDVHTRVQAYIDWIVENIEAE